MAMNLPTLGTLPLARLEPKQVRLVLKQVKLDRRQAMLGPKLVMLDRRRARPGPKLGRLDRRPAMPGPKLGMLDLRPAMPGQTEVRLVVLRLAKLGPRQEKQGRSGSCSRPEFLSDPGNVAKPSHQE